MKVDVIVRLCPGECKVWALVRPVSMRGRPLRRLRAADDRWIELRWTPGVLCGYASAMDFADLRYEKRGQVALITLDRPDARNAYSEAMVDSLVGAVDAAADDDGVRCAVLTGAGKAFCAGGDLKKMQQDSGMFSGGPAELRGRYLTGIHRIPRRIARFEKPLIAAVNGPAMGAGLDLACMCDIRVASEKAKFGSAFINVGLVPGDGGAYFLTRAVGFSRALEMMLTGRAVDAQEALGMALVHELTAPDALIDTAMARAQALCNKAPIALRLAKRATHLAIHSELQAALDLAATYQGIAQNTEDHGEALAALLEKRAPVFKGS